jgi:exosome complex RNA-binding protein Csl4
VNGIPLFTVLSGKNGDFIITRIVAAQERQYFVLVISISEKLGNFKDFHVSLNQK